MILSTLNKNQLPLDIKLLNTVLFIKEEAAKKMNIDCEYVVLFFNVAAILYDNKKLKDVTKEKVDTLFICLAKSFPGSIEYDEASQLQNHEETKLLTSAMNLWDKPDKLINIFISSTDNKFPSLFVSGGSDKPSIIKYIISNKIDIPAKNLRLFLDKACESELENDSDLNRDLNNQLSIYYKIETDLENLIRYEFLGNGAFGTVNRCLDIEENKCYALKKYKFSKKQIRECEIFKTEIDNCQRLGTHPRIVKFERSIQVESSLYILMEFMSGGSLRLYLEENGALKEPQIAKMAKQILEAIDYLHVKKCLHRDIKGDNVLLDGEYNAKLCDFGLSKILNDVATTDFLNGMKQSYVGTAYWMAPEVINGEDYGIKADIWSFGATLIEMLTGKRPYHNLGPLAVIFKIGGDKKLEFDKPEGMSDSLLHFINICLKPDPLERPSTSELLKHPFIQ